MLRPIHLKTISSHTDEIWTVCLSPTQQFLCSAGHDKKVILTNLSNETERIFEGHTDYICGSCFSFDGKILATCSHDKTIRIWNVENGQSFELKGHSRNVYDVQFFHFDSKKVVSGGSDKTIKIWDAERREEISTLKDCNGSVYCVDLLPSNQTLVSGDYYNEIRLFDLRSNNCEKVLYDHTRTVNSVQFDPNSFYLASGSRDKTIKLFDVRKSYQVVHSFENHSDWVRSVCFHPSGKYLISGSSEPTIKVFDLEEMKVLFTLKDHKHTVTSVCFSVDGDSFASGSRDRNVFVWKFGGDYSLKKQISSLKRKFEEKEKEWRRKTQKTRTEHFLSHLEKSESLVLDPSLHFRKRYFVGINQKIDKIIFHDTGREKDFKDFKLRQKEQIPDCYFETIVSDPKNDKILKRFITSIRTHFFSRWKECQMNIKKNHQKVGSNEFQFFEELIQRVSNFFGGVSTPQNNLEQKCEQKIQQLKELKQKNNEPVNVIYLGELKGNGICRHRSILFKLVCDVLGIRCRLLRGWFRHNEKNYGHCWNMIQLGGKFFVVDVMLQLKIFSEIDTRSYINLGGPLIEVSKEEKTLELIQRDYLSTRELIKSGSFGSVYEVEVDLVDTFKSKEEFTTKREFVAVKELNVTDLSEKTGSNFWKYCEREMMFLRFLNNCNIIQYLGSFRRTSTHRRTGEKVEYFCLVMEFFNRTCYSFKKRLEKEENSCRTSFYHKLVELFIFLIEVCKGLRYMHSVGVIHFDLHPDNILVQWNEQKKRIQKVVITDFGGAKEKEASFRTSLPAGAPLFTAPEIRKLRMKSIDEEKSGNKKKIGNFRFTEKSDIYSFGKVMEIFNSFLEGFPEIMKLEEECLEKNPLHRPSLEKMIYLFKNRLRYVNQELKKLFEKSNKRMKNVFEEEEEEEDEGEIE